MSELIPSDAVKAIQASVETRIIQVDDEQFSTRPIHRIPVREDIDPVNLSTLTGLVDFISIGSGFAKDSFIHVASPTRVSFMGPAIYERNQVIRDIYAIADCSELTNGNCRLGQFISQEDFIINLLTNFVDGENRAELLRVVGNLEDAKATRTQDDGITQTVTVRSGIRRVGEESIGPILRLAPYRTFREVAQPESDFLFRMRTGERCAGLFEADGKAWKLDAISAISEWLKSVPVPEDRTYAIVA